MVARRDRLCRRLERLSVSPVVVVKSAYVIKDPDFEPNPRVSHSSIAR